MKECLVDGVVIIVRAPFPGPVESECIEAGGFVIADVLEVGPSGCKEVRQFFWMVFSGNLNARPAEASEDVIDSLVDVLEVEVRQTWPPTEHTPAGSGLPPFRLLAFE